MLFIWLMRATALSSLFSLFASPLFLILYHPRLHAQPLLFSHLTEIKFITLFCPSLLSRVCLWQLGWVLIGFMVVRSMLRCSDRIYGGVICASVGLCGFDWFSFLFFFSWMMVVMWLWVCDFGGWGLWFMVVVTVVVVFVAVVVVEWV